MNGGEMQDINIEAGSFGVEDTMLTQQERTLKR